MPPSLFIIITPPFAATYDYLRHADIDYVYADAPHAPIAADAMLITAITPAP